MCHRHPVRRGGQAWLGPLAPCINSKVINEVYPFNLTNKKLIRSRWLTPSIPLFACGQISWCFVIFITISCRYISWKRSQFLSNWSRGFHGQVGCLVHHIRVRITHEMNSQLKNEVKYLTTLEWLHPLGPWGQHAMISRKHIFLQSQTICLWCVFISAWNSNQAIAGRNVSKVLFSRSQCDTGLILRYSRSQNSFYQTFLHHWPGPQTRPKAENLFT